MPQLRPHTIRPAGSAMDPPCYKPPIKKPKVVERRSRKGHKKSRQGCYECKRRKLKCQESRPRCENCSRLSLPCRYLAEIAIEATQLKQQLAPTQLCSTPQQTPIFSQTDMRLFHHFLVAAFPHLPVRADNIWIPYLTPIAHQRDYLMHAMLALSASHLEKLAPSNLTIVAKSHRLKAIRGLNEVLSQPLHTTGDGDAAIATCYALLMQSWYMDDGLPASLVMTRSCQWTTRWVRDQQVNSLLAGEDCHSRIANMLARIKDSPNFDTHFIDKAATSTEALRPLCSESFELEILDGLKNAFQALAWSSAQCYEVYVKIDTIVNELDHTSLMQLMDPKSVSGQLLLAHLVALHIVMRPIACRERKTYSVTMYGIRMNTWIPGIYHSLPEEYRHFLGWPMCVSGLQIQGTVEMESLQSPCAEVNSK